MLKSVNQWALPIDDENNNLSQVCEELDSLGFDGIELCVEPVSDDYFGLDNDDSGLKFLADRVKESVGADKHVLQLDEDPKRVAKIRKQVEMSGLDVFSVTTIDLFQYPLTSSNDDRRLAGIEMTKKLINLCSQLNANTVLVEPGVVTEDTSYAAAYENCFESIVELSQYAEDKEVELALENVGGKFLLSPLEFRDFLDEVGSTSVGAYFDVANILPYGYPQDWIRVLGEHLMNIHFKDYNASWLGPGSACNPFDGDVNWAEVKKSLLEQNYTGPITAEVLPPAVWKAEFISELANKMDYFINDL